MLDTCMTKVSQQDKRQLVTRGYSRSGSQV